MRKTFMKKKRQLSKATSLRMTLSTKPNLHLATKMLSPRTKPRAITQRLRNLTLLAMKLRQKVSL